MQNNDFWEIQDYKFKSRIGNLKLGSSAVGDSAEATDTQKASDLSGVCLASQAMGKLASVTALHC